MCPASARVTAADGGRLSATDLALVSRARTELFGMGALLKLLLSGNAPTGKEPKQDLPDAPGGLTEAIPWVMAEGDELGHMRISNRKALAAGLTCRPLLETARDTLAWRQSDAVPEAGVRVVRRRMVSRWIDGSLHVWTQRVVLPGASEGSSGLRYDTLTWRR